jgi:hypothetical protein
VSSDTSPPSGYQLETPARTGGAAGGAVTGQQLPASVRQQPAAVRQQPASPSWLQVIGTTIRLWFRRRVLRVPDSGKISRARRAGLAAALIIVVVAAAGGIAAAVMLPARMSGAGGGNQRPTVRPTLTPAQAAVAAAALANGRAAAIWVADHVAHGLVIGCDPATCAAILGAGYPTGGQLILPVILRQGVSLPGPGSVIVATTAVRSLYGPQLVSGAPAVIAAFGSGAAAVQVRVAVAGGPQAYSQAARRAMSARRRAGHKLLQQPNLHARAVARKDLGSGLVDPRLTAVLRRLAGRYPVFIVRFGDAGPLAGRTVPFRMVEIAVPATQAAYRIASEVAGMRKLLRRLPAPDRPELLPVRKVHGKRVLELRFPAPSPF